jgi:hypothetical protein
MGALTWIQPEDETQVLASTVVVVLAVLSFKVAVAQSNVRLSGQVTLYQNDSLLMPDGTVKVWAMLESPLVGVFVPAWAAKEPECGPDVVIEVAAPLVVQPENVPVSKPPLTIPPVLGGVTVRL